ncbi:MAG: putative lipid II flippase FtsW [Thermoanaerobacterales bacterium]|nr:putative lipid II flippase FtsW [Thermoanaerobacterales bacterium]
MSTRTTGRGARRGSARPGGRGGQAGARARHPSAQPPPPPGRSGLFVALAFLIVVFNLFGLVMVMSASSVVALDEHGSTWYYVMRQAAWAAAGTVLLVIVARIDYHRWRRWSGAFLFLALALLVAVLIPGVGRSLNGATRWIGVGQLTIQPSEIAKLAMLVWVADLLSRRAALMHNTRATLRPVIVVLVVGATLVMLQPNLGTTLVMAGIALSLCFVGGTPAGPLAGWTTLGLGAAVAAALAAPYRRDRVLAFLDPWADPMDRGYQNIQSLVGIANGGLFGTGLGASRAKWGYLPLAHSDFIFAIVGEELGLIGATVVIGLFGLLAIIGVRIALHAPDRFGLLLAVGVTAWLCIQAFVNIGAVIGILPITGVPLPFVSAGGSSLVVAMAGAGLLLSVARQATVRSLPPRPPERAR